MKRGFRVLIHKRVPNEYADAAVYACQNFVTMGESEKSYRRRGQSSRSFYQRGILGLEIQNTNRKLVFRRLVKNRRIFGVVPVEELEMLDGSPVNNTGCMCSHDNGGKRVRLKNGFNEQDFTLYYETGEIKG